MNYCPMSHGRSIDEFFRLVEAPETSDKFGVAIPETWKPGENVTAPPPQAQAAAEARKSEGHDYVDWHFSKEALPTTADSKKARAAAAE